MRARFDFKATSSSQLSFKEVHTNMLHKQCVCVNTCAINIFIHDIFVYCMYVHICTMCYAHGTVVLDV